ncbi:hypothetical protein LEP1GSC038_1593 [Leptospira weilii str. 2006001855]|uniref:Uncharacterized protein n=1 Tax=Leptospira weilii str. 2006001855 TaxID=996804 RepID=M6FLN3_9LEPT|nr:hypothetical protein LEP1GSC038_1593 [Leptospira weilii str. 2006001855]
MQIGSVIIKKIIFKFTEIVYILLTFSILNEMNKRIESGDEISWAKRAPNITIPS